MIGYMDCDEMIIIKRCTHHHDHHHHLSAIHPYPMHSDIYLQPVIHRLVVSWSPNVPNNNTHANNQHHDHHQQSSHQSLVVLVSNPLCGTQIFSPMSISRDDDHDYYHGHHLHHAAHYHQLLLNISLYKILLQLVLSSILSILKETSNHLNNHVIMILLSHHMRIDRFDLC